MDIQPKYNIGDKIIYDDNKIGYINGIEIYVRNTFYEINIKIMYLIKTDDAYYKTLLESLGNLRNEKDIELF